MKVDIRFMRCEHQFGRAVMYAQLFNKETDALVFAGSLAQILQLVFDKKLEIVNSQFILDSMVRLNGFGC